MADAAEAELRNGAAGQGRYLTGRYCRATAIGPSRYSRWWRRRWILPAGRLCVTDTNLMTPPQERHRAAGRQRTPGQGPSRRVRPPAAHPLRISKEGGSPVQANETVYPTEYHPAGRRHGHHAAGGGLKLGGQAGGAEHHRPGAHRGHPRKICRSGQPHHQCQHLWRFRTSWQAASTRWRRSLRRALPTASGRAPLTAHWRRAGRRPVGELLEPNGNAGL